MKKKNLLFTLLLFIFYSFGMSQTFTIVGLPDTQKYTKEENGGTKEMFYSQTQWISNNTNTENIVFVSHFGDITDDGDLAAESQWIYADNAMSTLDNVVPYAVLPGNHDKFGGTTKYNQYFGVDRFSGYVYYGGNYQGNENNYCLFSAGGMEFILISLEYWPLSDTRDWASSVLNTYSNRRAIITTHSLLNTDGTWTDNQHGGGENVYNMAKTHSNVFLMLCGHNHGEYVRSDTYDGNTIYTVLADYQDYTNGGNGYLRIMEFDPINDQINFKTYSPYINQWMTGNSSQFSIPYDMDYTSPEITVDLKVFLEGPFFDGSMNTNLNNNGYIPLNQPYNPTLPYYGNNSPVWLYNGSESVSSIPDDVVDWVVVQLRNSNNVSSATSLTILENKAGFIKSDGSIVDTDGISNMTFNSTDSDITDNLYIVIYHRNHIGIISNNPVVKTNDIYSYDFSSSQTQVYGGTNGHKELSSGVWGMISGDGDANGLVQNTDETNVWRVDLGSSGYLGGDFDMNGLVQNTDETFRWLPNLGKGSQIPTETDSQKSVKIEIIPTNKSDISSTTKYYDLSGRFVGDDLYKLEKGIYIKITNKNNDIEVKKIYKK